MEDKTPASALNELCDQERVPKPVFECIPHESDPKMFVYIVGAFDIYTKGDGRSKQQAKHNACANLISKRMPAFMTAIWSYKMFDKIILFWWIPGILSETERYKYKLAALPRTPANKQTVEVEAEAIGTLIGYCEQHGWPMVK